MDYKDRLKLSLDGKNINLFSKTGVKIVTGYTRIVIGDRGPYIEFNKEHLIAEHIYMPSETKWRIKSKTAFYLEYRTYQDYIMIYYQKRLVDYADYKIKKFYISPFDLYLNNNIPIITKLK